MTHEHVREAMLLLSISTPADIDMAIGFLLFADAPRERSSASLAPPIGARHVDYFRQAWGGQQHAQTSGEAWFWLRFRAIETPDGAGVFAAARPNLYDQKVLPDGTKVKVEVLPPLSAASFISEAAMDRCDRVYKRIMACSAKVSMPRKLAHVERSKFMADAVMSNALLRRSATSGGINAACTALFDVNLLVNGQFKQYLGQVGASGLYGGVVSGCAAKLEHPFFGHGAVVSLGVSSAVGTYSLAKTGDWARFAKNSGRQVAASAAALRGARLGACVGAAAYGPIGATAGGTIGAIAGGCVGGWAADATFLGAETDHEVEAAYEHVTKEIAEIGLKPNPALTPREFHHLLKKSGEERACGMPMLVQVTEAMAAHIDGWQDALEAARMANPARFERFLELLRAQAATRE